MAVTQFTSTYPLIPRGDSCQDVLEAGSPGSFVFIFVGGTLIGKPPDPKASRLPSTVFDLCELQYWFKFVICGDALGWKDDKRCGPRLESRLQLMPSMGMRYLNRFRLFC